MKKVELTEAMSLKYPEWVVFIITADSNGKANLMPAGWCMITSGNPPMLAVSVHPNRYTHTLIEQTGEFVVAWAGAGQEEAVKFAGATSGRSLDKFAQLNLKSAKAAAVNAPLVEGCAMAFECRLAGKLATGDHTLFAGRIVAAHVADPPVEKIMNFGKEQFVAATMKR